MTSCPCGDISQEPDRNNKSLLTVYLMAFCSRLTCTLPASISFFRGPSGMRVKNYTRDRKGVIGVHAVLEQKTTIHCNYLSLHGLAIVSVPKKARRRPVYR